MKVLMLWNYGFVVNLNMRIFLFLFILGLSISNPELIYAQKKDTLTIRLDCSAEIKKPAPILILIRSSSGEEVLLVDSLLKFHSPIKESWIDCLRVYRPSSIEALKYGDNAKSGLILLAVKEGNFSSLLKSLRPIPNE